MASKREKKTQPNSNYFNAKSVQVTPVEGGLFSIIGLSENEGPRKYALAVGKTIISKLRESEEEILEELKTNRELYIAIGIVSICKSEKNE